jgi:hypothetical protein
MNAERRFLPHLEALHRKFPRLRIVLEHATTKEAIDTVKRLGPTVACTITAHHLALTVDDWAGQSFNFCKPVAKYPEDREALRLVIREGTVYCCIRHYHFIDTHNSRSHEIFPRIRFSSASCGKEGYCLSKPVMRRRDLHSSHSITSRGASIGFLWGPGQA